MKRVLFLCLLGLLFGTSSCHDFNNPFDGAEKEPPIETDPMLFAPANPEYSFIAIDKVKISWEDLNTEEDRYRINVSGAINKSIDLPANSTEYVLENISKGSYSVEIVAIQKNFYSGAVILNFSAGNNPFVNANFYFPERETNFIRLHFSIDTCYMAEERGIYWGVQPDPTVENSRIPVSIYNPNEQKVLLEDLNPNTCYYFRMYIKYPYGTFYGETKKINTYKESAERIIALFDEKPESEPTLQAEGRNISVDWGDRDVIICGDEITSLDISNKRIRKLDLRRGTNLNYLDCSQNQLTELNVVLHDKLKVLYCADNQLKELFTPNRWHFLTNIRLENNKLTPCQLNHLFTIIPESGYSLSIKGNPDVNKCTNSFLKNWSFIDIIGDGSATCE